MHNDSERSPDLAHADFTEAILGSFETMGGLGDGYHEHAPEIQNSPVGTIAWMKDAPPGTTRRGGTRRAACGASPDSERVLPAYGGLLGETAYIRLRTLRRTGAAARPSLTAAHRPSFFRGGRGRSSSSQRQLGSEPS